MHAFALRARGTKQPISYSSLHIEIVTWVGLSSLLELLEFSAWFKESLVSGNHPLFVRVLTVLCLNLLSAVSCFVFVSGVSVFLSASIRKWNQMWHQSVSSVFAPFSSLVTTEIFSVTQLRKKSMPLNSLHESFLTY
jgi:hypothetical protein